uniref:Cytochrome c oxidase subunit 7B, mitochondrial n=1 Tax=Salvator merianae TaxID=96440 RepID=A0A8D0BGQ5_SALMN
SSRVARERRCCLLRSFQRTATRRAHSQPNFHDKYGNIILLGGATFCASTWFYIVTQGGIEWNLSPVGRITPKEWREK